MSKYKATGKTTLFDAENQAKKLSEMGDPLEKLNSVIDFEQFREELEEVMKNRDTKSNAGASQYDVVMMFKIMVLKQFYNMSYAQTEYQIVDRNSFKRFLGLASGDSVPDANTIRNFFERMSKFGLVESMFHSFVDKLASLGFIFNEGQLVDASFVLAPKQRNTHEENKKLKDGEGRELWNDKPCKNRVKSSVRSRVEHVFGFMEGAMRGLTIRTIGFARAVENIFMKCLVYNLFRYEQIVRYGLH